MYLIKRYIIILLIITPFPLQAQDALLDSLFAELESDTLTILDLLDSMIRMEDQNKHELSLKVSYISNIITAGRDFGINQYGLSPGISYFHHSGFFGDINGYWNSEYEPNYNFTIVSAGYMFMIKNFWTNALSYEHYFFNGEKSNISNSLDLTSIFNYKFLDAGFDYSYMFGQETAHRISANLSGYKYFKKIWIFDRISFSPSFSILWGNESIMYRKFNFEEYDFLNYEKFNQLTRLQKRRLVRRLIKDHYLNGETEPLRLMLTGEKNVFGLMNYNISFPVKLTIKNSSLLFTYNYNIPVELPGELYDWPEYSYFGISFYQSFSF